MIDKSNNLNTEKWLAIMVRVFEVGVGPRTRLLDMPISRGETSEAIFNDIDAIFTSLNIPWSNCIGFASDNSNVMVGKKNSVITRIQQRNPNIFSIGCICHLAILCAKDGIKQLTMPVDDLMVDIYYHFEHSSKRRKTYKEFQLFTEVDDLDILNHCQTDRWPSLHKVVDQILNQYAPLLRVTVTLKSREE
ncbi:hypothetical protein ACJMK2_035591 [Sinanodonta woodiana]|uniref:Uncharacterized protein n=1 Tax=Sinanodonta woodiana TaxID=1069815 RepID=A0ABD3WWR8_SINWO